MADCRGSVAVSPTPRQVGNGWVLDAVFANGQTKTIKGFKTQAEASEWAGSARHAVWLRDNRGGLREHAVVAVLTTLERSALVLELIALTLVESRRRLLYQLEGTRLAAATARAILAIVSAAGPVLKFLRRLQKAPRAAKRRPLRRRRALIAVGLIFIVVVFVTNRRGDQPAASDWTADSHVTVVAKLEHPHSVEVPEASDPIALLIEQLSAGGAEPAPQVDAAAEPTPMIEATAEPAVALPAQGQDGETEVTARRDPSRPGRRTIVGVWVPQPGPCSARNLREGPLPAVISTHGARAGETSCVFKSQKQDAGDWLMRANCSNPHESWTTNVRLSVKGDRLTWTSKRGTQAYIRCRSNV